MLFALSFQFSLFQKSAAGAAVGREFKCFQLARAAVLELVNIMSFFPFFQSSEECSEMNMQAARNLDIPLTQISGMFKHS